MALSVALLREVVAAEAAEAAEAAVDMAAVCLEAAWFVGAVP